LDLTITGKHMDVTESLRTFVQEKMERLNKYKGFLQSAQVTLYSENELKVAEVVLTPNRGKSIVAVEKHEDLYAAIDLIVDTLTRQVSKLKERVKDHGRKAGDELPPEPKEEKEVTYEQIVDEMGLSAKPGKKGKDA